MTTAVSAVMRETRGRLKKSMQWLTNGFQENSEEILQSAMFDAEYVEMAIAKDI